jgi:gamma-glutamyl-gamma-aminobutyraldehyde dehydrogenase
MPTPYSFIRDGEKARWRWMAAKTYTWPSARPFLSTPRRKPTSAGKRSSARYWWSPVLKAKPRPALANDSDYGLGAAVWTRDLSRAHRMSRRLKAGSS